MSFDVHKKKKKVICASTKYNHHKFELSEKWNFVFSFFATAVVVFTSKLISRRDNWINVEYLLDYTRCIWLQKNFRSQRLFQIQVKKNVAWL